mmetsp:Transcript_150744/g.274350  ORF Transcript_150744/g.274350 Transcript_150744/m.274350 type:complete len:262 (+) Transcript_150744:89-874(+)
MSMMFMQQKAFAPHPASVTSHGISIALSGGFTADMRVCAQSLVLVGIAECFDKTWFIALFMALRHDRSIVFLGSILALLVHTVIAAGLGLAISRIFTPGTLNFMAAGLYAIFALLYTRDWYTTGDESDVFANGKEEAEEVVSIGNSAPQGYTGADARQQKKTNQCEVFMKCFAAVFVAEWGDRTQIAMVGQHASLPLVPVCVGSAVAFLLLTWSAVCVASLFDKLRMSEKSVRGISALSFAIFALIALHNGFQALHQNKAL